MKRSSGILPYRINKGKLEVLLAHPGGPFWIEKNRYSICKGEYIRGKEKILSAAKREFFEETNFELNGDSYLFLGSYKQKSNKLLSVFAYFVSEDFCFSDFKSNSFKREWPKGSSNIVEFFEMDDIAWFNIEEAYNVIFPGQIVFLKRLVNLLKSNDL